MQVAETKEVFSERAVLGNFDTTRWPRLDRQVFLLSDGRRSVERIAALLMKSPKAVYETMISLQMRGFLYVRVRSREEAAAK